MALDKKNLRRLLPEDRLKKLREIEEHSKKELEEAEKLIKESKEDIKKEEALSSVDIPEEESVDITKLFDDKEGLEETVQEAPQEIKEENILYDVGKIREYVENIGKGPVNNYTMERVDKMNEELNSIDYTQLSKQAADKLNATRNVVYEMKKHLGMK